MLSIDQVFKLQPYEDISDGIYVFLRPEWEEKIRTGYVVDQRNKPVQNATVAHKRTNLAILTTAKGSFCFSAVGRNDVLEVYGKGLKHTVYKVGKGKMICIQVEKIIANEKQ